MLSNVLKCPMLFFDSTPKGRLLARFSNDLNVLDYGIIFNFRQCLANVFKVRVFIRKILKKKLKKTERTVRDKSNLFQFTFYFCAREDLIYF